MSATKEAPGLVFEVPMRTGRGQNDREHWREKAHRIKREKEIISLALKAYQPIAGVLLENLLENIAQQSPVLITLTRIAPSQGLDGDNLSGALKAVRDRIAKAMRVDDRESERLAWKYDQKRGPWGVRVEFSARKPEVQGPGWTAEDWKEVASWLGAAQVNVQRGGMTRRQEWLARLAEDAEAMAIALGGRG